MNPARPVLAMLVFSMISLPLRAVVSPAAVPPTLISNGGFDTALQNWSVIGTAEWVATDAKGNPASGSVRLRGSAGVSGTGSVSKCLFLTPGKIYVASALAWISQGGANDGAAIFIAPYTTAACSGVGVVTSSYIARGDQGRWAPLSVLFGVPANAQSIGIGWLAFRSSTATAITVHIDEAAVREVKCSTTAAQNCIGCLPALCLDGERFRVSASWKTSGGQEGAAQPIPFTADSGSFWFFSSSNIELDVKVLDGCAVNGRHWVFASGGTNVEVTLTVTDTKTGVIKTYTNPQSHLFSTIADTNAFACP